MWKAVYIATAMHSLAYNVDLDQTAPLGWMDDLLFYVHFNSISVISEQF